MDRIIVAALANITQWAVYQYIDSHVYSYNKVLKWHLLLRKVRMKSWNSRISSSLILYSFLPQRVTPRTSGPKASVTAKEPALQFTLSEGRTASPNHRQSLIYTFLYPTCAHDTNKNMNEPNHLFTFDCILLLKPLKLNHAHMFTSEAELQ